MLKNRALQVKVVKNDGAPTEEADETTFDEKAAVVAEHVNGVVKKAIFGVAMYIVLDTGRKLAVIAAKQ